jgi:glutamine synthetase
MPATKTLTFSELEQWFDKHHVTEIECLVPDLTGVARSKIPPREKFTEDRGMRLPEVVVAMGVTGEFPEEGPHYDVIDPTDRDMHLRPDPSTVRSETSRQAYSIDAVNEFDPLFEDI